MLSQRKILIACFCLWTAVTGVCAASSAAPSQTIEAKIALESSLEKRLLAVLQKALGTDDVIVIVKADLYTAEELEDEIMPGVPVQQTPTSGAIAMTMLKSLSAVVIIDQSTPKKDLELIERTAQDILSLDKGRGDRFVIEKLNMRRVVGAAAAQADAGKDRPWTDTFLKPQLIVSLMWLTCVLGAMLLIYSSFMRPLIGLAREALTHWASAKAERSPAAAEVPKLAATETPKLTNGSRYTNGNGHKHGAEREKLPFGFINEKNLPMLAHLMRRMTPRTMAVITHYLSPPLAAQILVGLKADKRGEVVRYMSRVTQLQETEVKAIEVNVRTKINYLMGGEDKLAAILEEMPAGMQEELLGTLRSKDPSLGRRLGQRIVTLEDISLLEGEDIKTLVRSVQLKSIAAVLKDNEGLQERLLPKLTTGMAQWLTQEIELSQQLPPAILAAEQKTVLNALSQLVREGAIILRREEAEQDEPFDAGDPGMPIGETEAPPAEEYDSSFEAEMGLGPEDVPPAAGPSASDDDEPLDSSDLGISPRQRGEEDGEQPKPR